MGIRDEVISFTEHNLEGAVTGGSVTATGLQIRWQDGPLSEGTAPNGAFLENVIQAAIERVEAYQATDLRCRENALVITHLQEAQHWLNHRRKDRYERGVANSYKP